MIINRDEHKTLKVGIIIMPLGIYPTKWLVKIPKSSYWIYILPNGRSKYPKSSHWVFLSYSELLQDKKKGDQFMMF
jgi:hypothetical protein